MINLPKSRREQERSEERERERVGRVGKGCQILVEWELRLRANFSPKRPVMEIAWQL